MSKVFVIDTDQHPLTPVHPGRARLLLKAGTFTIATSQGKVTDVPHRYCRPLHRSDGYAYHQGARISPPPTSPKAAHVSAPAFQAEVPTGGYSWTPTHFDVRDDL